MRVLSGVIYVLPYTPSKNFSCFHDSNMFQSSSSHHVLGVSLLVSKFQLVRLTLTRPGQKYRIVYVTPKYRYTNVHQRHSNFRQNHAQLPPFGSKPTTQIHFCPKKTARMGHPKVEIFCARRQKSNTVFRIPYSQHDKSRIPNTQIPTTRIRNTEYHS